MTTLHTTTTGDARDTPTPRHTTRPSPRGTVRLAALVAAAVLAGCTGAVEPTPTPTPAATATDDDPLRTEVVALGLVVDELDAVLTALRDALERAAGGDAGALTEAAALLVAEVDAVVDPRPPTVLDDEPTEGVAVPDDAGAAPTTSTGDPGASPTTAGDDGTAATDGTSPILPGPDVSRLETVTYGDLLTRLLAASRSAGAQGEAVQRFLADPLAGDLGAWQRAPGDLLALIGAAAATGDLEAAQDAILALDGEAPRALAWVAHGLRNPDDASEAATRALAHLAIIDLSFEELS